MSLYMIPANRFQALLDQGKVILADGAMGTMLHSRGASFDSSFDELNLTQPALVAQIHSDYVEAGAQIIETNTFGANRFKLSAHGLENQVMELNQVAVRLARQAADLSTEEILVAGSVGPLGVRLAPFGRVKPEQAFAAYCEQIAALAEAGCDLLMIETQTDLLELGEAVRAARSTCQLPIVATLTFTRDDRTLLGDSPQQVARKLSELGVEVLGANCSGGPAQLLRILSRMRQAAPQARLAVMPNAGWPERVAGRIMYPATADYFGEYALSFCQAGAIFIGGCCGTTPEHIRAMRQSLNSGERPCTEVEPLELEVLASPAPGSSEPPTHLARTLAQGQFVLSVEMDPPRGFSTHKLIAGASLLAEAGADVINVADSPMARMRMSPWAACQLIQSQIGLETVLHFPTRGRNMLRVQGDLLAAHALGVRNVFVVMGDPTAIGDYPDAMDDYDLVPTGLIHLIQHGFNRGVDHAGSDIGEATSFFTGCALNLCAKDIEREIRLLQKKLAAGADFALTQPVYDAGLARSFLDTYQTRFGELKLPILVGVLPLYSARHAAFLHNEVPGIQIPATIQARILSADDRAPEVGVQIAIELLESLSGVVQGAYIMPPFGRYDLAAEIIEAIRAAP
jgi:methionine synthase I (cobalamin-dependent)/5,10-methylenetetrahydrofolate reductase